MMWASVLLLLSNRGTCQIAYSTVDRATVRVIALDGLEMVKERFNGDEVHYAAAIRGHGSGVLVSRDGLVVTAHHVVAGASRIVVTKLNESSPYLARVLADSAEHDIAVLGIAGTHRDIVPIPKKAVPISARQTVFAIGFPIEIDRADPQSSRGIVAGMDPTGLLQLNISINPGNSGGPVIDEADQLLGIAVSRHKDAEAMAYVVPVGVAKAVVETVTPQATLTAHKNAELSAPADRLLASLIVAFAQQGSLIDGIAQGIARDHLSSNRQLIEGILGTHQEPDVLALVAAYFWNESLVLKIRGDDEWRGQQLRSLALCNRARGTRAEASSWSPFVAEAVALEQRPTASRDERRARDATSTVANARTDVDANDAPRSATPPKSANVATNSSRTRDAKVARARGLAGFRLGWNQQEVAAACRAVGHEFTVETNGLRCNGPVEKLLYDAKLELQMCTQTVCRITMRMPLEDAEGKTWLAHLGNLRQQFEDRFGRASRNVKLPEGCRRDILPCLRTGTARLEYTWDSADKLLSLVVGNVGAAPAMTVTLSIK